MRITLVFSLVLMGTSCDKAERQDSNKSTSGPAVSRGKHMRGCVIVLKQDLDVRTGKKCFYVNGDPVGADGKDVLNTIRRRQKQAGTKCVVIVNTYEPAHRINGLGTLGAVDYVRCDRSRHDLTHLDTSVLEWEYRVPYPGTLEDTTFYFNGKQCGVGKNGFRKALELLQNRSGLKNLVIVGRHPIPTGGHPFGLKLYDELEEELNTTVKTMGVKVIQSLGWKLFPRE